MPEEKSEAQRTRNSAKTSLLGTGLNVISK